MRPLAVGESGEREKRKYGKVRCGKMLAGWLISARRAVIYRPHAHAPDTKPKIKKARKEKKKEQGG